MQVASYGAGLQSTAMLMANEHGLIDPPIEVAIFADTGAEPRRVIETYNWISSPNVSSIEVHRVQGMDLKDMLTSDEYEGPFAGIPAFLANGGRGRRQCTERAKIRPIRKKIRELLGVSAHARIPAGTVIQSIGITTDEAARMTMSEVKYIEHRYPLIELGWSKQDCIDWLEKYDYPIPAKSACIFCPFHSNHYWLSMQEHEPDEFAEAVAIEKRMNETRERRKLKHQEFLHEDRKPLGEIDIKPRGNPANTFVNECSGMCGV